MKPDRKNYLCERCDEAVSLPADLTSLPRCNFCGRDSLVLLDAPAAAPVTPEKARQLFHQMREQVLD
jgi:hypothetical protein